MTYKQQAVLLGQSVNTDATIYRYKTGKTSLPLARDLQDRFNHYFAIYRYLKQIYPNNLNLAYHWMNTRNQDFALQSSLSATGYFTESQLKYEAIDFIFLQEK